MRVPLKLAFLFDNRQEQYLTHIKQIILASLLANVAICQTAGRIQGIVNDDSGKPVAGAYVIANPQSGSNRTTLSGITSADGKFSVDNMPAASYLICIQVPGGPYLDPCQRSKGTEISLASGQVIANRTFTVSKGSLLQVRLQDPKKLFSAADDLLIGVYLPSGFFQHMRLSTTGAGERTYDVAVPLRTHARVAIVSKHLEIADGTGKALAVTAPGAVPGKSATSDVVTIQGQAVESAVPVSFSVTGRK